MPVATLDRVCWIATPLLAVAPAATRSTGTRRAVLFAFATGALFGLTVAFTKETVVLSETTASVPSRTGCRTHCC